jgi:pyridoxamine 5'-phosphate oxidase family protein
VTVFKPAELEFRGVTRSRRAAIVIDEVLPLWRPRGIEVRGTAEAIATAEPSIGIHPDRVVSWGLAEAVAEPAP